MQNQINELQPRFEFLRIEPYNDGSAFGDTFTKSLNDTNDYHRRSAARTLQNFLHTISPSRTKESPITGQPILNLPETMTLNHYLAFTSQTVIEHGGLIRRRKRPWRSTGTMLRTDNFANGVVLKIELPVPLI